MRYFLDSFRPRRKGEYYEIMFTNGKDIETIKITNLENKGWCLYSEEEKPLKFYSSAKDLVFDFVQELNEEE